jgi:hypothetical protein
VEVTTGGFYFSGSRVNWMKLIYLWVPMSLGEEVLTRLAADSVDILMMLLLEIRGTCRSSERNIYELTAG